MTLHPRHLTVLAFFITAGFSLLAGCGGAVIMSDRSAFTARPLDEFGPIAHVDIEALDAQYPGMPAVIKRSERAMEHLFYLQENGNWDFVDDVRLQYVVLDPEEEGYTTTKLFIEHGGRLEGFYGRITHPDGTVQTFSEQEMVEDRDDEGTRYSFAYPGVQKGSLVEESYRVRYRYNGDYYPPLEHEVSLQYDVPVDSLKFRYVCPETWGLKIKRIATNRMPPFFVDREGEAGKTVVVYEGANIPAIPDEPYSPYFKEMANYFEFMVNEIYLRGEKIYAAEADWSALGDRFKRYAMQSGTLFSDPAARAAEDLLAPGSTDLEKLEQIVRWVQQTITLDGEDGADNFATVLRNERGNRYLITGLTQAMLDRSGIDAEFLLIHPASEGFFDRDYVSGGQFTIPAVRARVNGEDYVVFPYITGLPVNFIPELYQGRPAMTIDGDGFQGIVQIPRQSAADYGVSESYSLRIDPDGRIAVEEEQVLRGAAGFILRKQLEGESEEEREDRMRERLTYTEGEVEAFSYSVENEEDYEAPLVVTLSYSISNLVTVTPVEVLFQTGGLLSPSSVREFKVDAAERHTPIRIYYDEVTERSITIEHPTAWTLATDLENADIQNRFGEATAAYQVEPGRISINQRLLLRATTATPARITSLLRLLGGPSTLNVPTLVFEAE